jgi:hypothetical protein
MSDPCTQKENIEKLLKIVTDGNGQPSLTQQVSAMSQIVLNMNKNITDYAKRQEDLIKEFGITNREFYEFKSHMLTVETERDKSDVRKRWRTGVFVSILIAILTILTTLGINRSKILASRIDNSLVPVNMRGIDSLPLYYNKN